MGPTDEQQTAVDAFTSGSDLVIQAGAGTGKTSTLRLLAATNPTRRGLYIAYNRAIKEEAARSFPGSVRCSTSHSLAYRTVGRRYQRRLGGPRQTARQAADILGITRPVVPGKDLAPLAPMSLARLALGTVIRYCHSADAEIAAWHVPHVLGYTPGQQQALAAELLPQARRAWDDIARVHGRLKVSHDHYLKLWALSGPRLEADYLLWDEAQDANGVMTGLLLGQTQVQRVAVGDSAQAIYGWRGAHDALAHFPGKRLTLSRSFRFGPDVAEEANQWLGLLDAPLRLTGYDAIRSRIEHLHRPAAVLCRTNAGAMAAAMRHMEAGQRVAIVGGGGVIRRLAYAALNLQAGRPTDHPELLAFSAWTDVLEYSREEDGGDLRPLVSLIDSYGPDAVIRAAEALADERTAQVVVSTAHKAKGREWATVSIHGDFSRPDPDKVTGRLLVRRDEAMLAYVAVTRARDVLDQEGLEWVVEVEGVTS